MSDRTGAPLVIIDGVRTPFAKAGGALAAIPAEELASATAREILDRTGIPAAAIDEVIYGCVGQSARAANIARVIALRAGVPWEVPAVTVHRNCASGMEAITQAMLRLHAGRGELFLVGGTESMSQYPLEFSEPMVRLFTKLARARTAGAKLGALLGFRPSHLKPRVALLEGLRDPIYGDSMGVTAENVARDFDIDREEQDAFALESHRRAAAAADRLREEMMVIADGRSAVHTDTAVRPDQSQAALAKLRPVFEKRDGTVTAGNACPVTDGAVSLLVASEDRARELGVEPLGYLTDFAYRGLDPTRMGLGPVHAMSALLAQRSLGLPDIDLFEINEAFAAQVLGVLRAAASPEWARTHLREGRPLGEIPTAALNVNGGAIALGHPVGATGARLVLTLLREMRRRDGHRGIASLCVGGGQGAALLLER